MTPDRTPRQRAVELLFGFPGYIPNDPDMPFILRGEDFVTETISVNDLTARIAAQDAAQ